MNKVTIFLISLSINLLMLVGYVKFIKPQIDEAAKGIASLVCPQCETK